MGSSSFVAGLDAGGSKTRLLGRWGPDGTTVDRQGPGANPNRVGRTAAGRILVELVRAAMEEGPTVDIVYVAAGVSGAGRADVQDPLSNALRDGLSRSDTTVEVEVVHDGIIALDAAYDAGSGIILIVGTGSVVLARTRDGRIRRTGGWGPILGDDGSGYALGRAGLRAVAEAFDGGTETKLRRLVGTAFDIHSQDDLLGAVYSEDFDVQAVAPLVVQAAADDDAAATQALEQETQRLTDQVRWLVESSDDVAKHLTLLGGMTESSYYLSVLVTRLRSAFGDLAVRTLETEPVVGALRRARRLMDAHPERGP